MPPGLPPGALVRTGHLRLPAGLPVGGLYLHDGEYQTPIGRAAEILGVSERHTRRLLSAYRGAGVAALAHGNRGRQPHNAVGSVDKNAGSGPDDGANQPPGNLIMGLLLSWGCCFGVDSEARPGNPVTALPDGTRPSNPLHPWTSESARTLEWQEPVRVRHAVLWCSCQEVML